MACVSVCYMYRARIGFKKVKKVILFGQRCKAREPADLLFVRGFISKTGVLRQYTSRVALYIELCRLPRLHLSRFFSSRP